MPFENMQFGHYKLLRQIGSGGMGEVYLAEDIRIARHVAIKIVRNEVAPYPNSSAAQEAARLFQREMKAISRLDHPHVLSLYDFGEQTINGVLMSYMVMPFRSEGSLADWLAKREGSDLLSFEDVAFIVYQAADALQEAHNQQLIHQDIKPSNFLIRARRDHPNRPDLFLADFGVSKLTTATATASQTVRGTPAYMSPEQWDGQPVPATDQYALAVMAYQLLTGCLPFQGSTMQVMRQHFTAQPKPPSALRPGIPVALAAVVLRALAKQPEERFPSIIEFAQAFQQAVHDSSSHSNTGAPIPPVSSSSPSLEPTILPQRQEVVLPDKAPQVHDLPPTVAAPEPLEKTPNILPVSPKKAESPQKAKRRRELIVALVIVLILTSIVGLGSYQIHVNTVNAQATADANSATSEAQYSQQTAAAATASSATSTANTDATSTAYAISLTPTPYPPYSESDPPSHLNFSITAQSILTNAQLASAIYNNNEPKMISSHFHPNDRVYLTFNLTAGQTGYVMAKWYSQGDNGNESAVLSLYGHGGPSYFARTYDTAGQGAVELYWCGNADCSYRLLAWVRSFTIDPF